MQDEYGLTASDRVLQKTPFSFDVSVWEFFWPLMSGATLVVARPGGHKDPAYLAELIATQGITTLHFVPSMLQVFVQEPAAAGCASLQRVICSGEALSHDLQTRFYDLYDSTDLHNLYGPTEAAIDVTYWACERDADTSIVPIGRPVANTQIYIVDSAAKPTPVGVAGELWIGGIQVARGYVNRPELTAERFITDPFSSDPDARIYKTGDLVRYRADGTIEFLGRIDHQVKLRGFRIELGEIEATLDALPAIEQSLVLLREETPGDKRLVAYISGANAAAPDIAELRHVLQQELPDYMVPNAFLVLDEFPLLPNGKVDRKALPAPEWQAANEYVAPRTPTEEVLADIWQAVLKVDQVGIHDDFFELGGHS
jgi:acyl-CoA synthetase (AMP-forming)/AMP-acid ligase II